MDSAPSEKPVNTSMVLSISSPFTSAPAGTKMALRIINKPPKPSTAKPATPKPITAPPVNDTFNALLRLVRAACAVRTLHPAEEQQYLRNSPKFSIRLLRRPLHR